MNTLNCENLLRFVFFCLLLFASGEVWAYPPNWEQKVNKEVIEDFKYNDKAEYIVVLESAKDIKFSNHWGKTKKANALYESLSQHADTSQRNILQYLDKKAVNYRSFYIVNTCWVRSDIEVMQWLASQPEVIKIVHNPHIEMESVSSNESANNIVYRDSIQPTWGIMQIKADSVWAMGITGQNVVVGGEDTGYDYLHRSLIQKFRGYSESDTIIDYSWHDAIHSINTLHGDTIISPENNPCGLDSKVPCDDHGHGTHTMGTMVGLDADHKIGVAPEAKWIGCRNMERGYGSPASYIECFEWFLAPTDIDDQDPRPEMAPHVINNSWSCPDIEGCNSDNWELMRLAIENLKKSGVVVVTSAGNSGRSCASINTAPSIFEESFAVGANDIRDTIANFSSRGPVAIDSSFRNKPDVVAPGVGVLSSTPNNTYSSFSGTSMSGPHVVGTVALMISANPNLAGQVEIIENILRETAVIKMDTTNCDPILGTSIPNNTYGYGRINALEAVKAALLVSDVGDEDLALSEVHVFPNPANTIVNFEVLERTEELALVINTVDGRRVLSRNWPISIQNLMVDTRDYSAGIYFYNLYNARGLVAKGKLSIIK